MACVDACPSGAISMIPNTYPPQQLKTEAVIAAQRMLGCSKVQQESIADAIAASSENAVTRQFAKAIAKSNRCMAEDILRESDYMLPQSKKVRKLLEAMLENVEPDFPKDAVKLLLSKLQRTN
jgi:Na+-translocating ferredoxin:NAD+ oxidoreductase RNF subunit RnfB